MNRCSRRALLPWLCLALTVSTAAAWGQGIRNFPPNALRGELTVTAPPAVRLDGREARLSPGARIRSAANTLMQPASLIGKTLVVNYLRDPAGMVHDVWLLNELEAAQPRASASTGRNFEFASEQDKPARDDGKTPYNQLPGYKR